MVVLARTVATDLQDVDGYLTYPGKASKQPSGSHAVTAIHVFVLEFPIERNNPMVIFNVIGNPYRPMPREGNRKD